MELAIHGPKILGTFENVPLLGTVTITQTLTVSWLVMGILTGLCVWLGSGLRVTGISRKQAVAEWIVTALVKFVETNMGPEGRRYLPLIGTIFASSIVSNLISLLGFWSPTGDLMTPLAWGIVVFVLIVRNKIRSAGLGGYFRGFLEPVFVLAPINVLSELFTPISMACRHFGNILSGTVISSLIYAALTVASEVVFGSRSVFPWLTVGIPALPSLYFDWFGGCIQAFIFCTLATLFLKRASQG